MKAALVGAGNRGCVYCDYSFDEPDELEIVAVVDIRALAREEVGERYHIPENMRFASLADFLETKIECDFVINATMDEMHYDTAKEILKAGYNLLQEKPIVPNREQLLELREMSEKDCKIFYELCLLSAKAVLLGRGCDTDKFAWNVWWTRDQNIDPPLFYQNIHNAIEAQAEEILLWEKARSVEIWKEIIKLTEGFTSGNRRDFIVITCKYGYYLYSLFETMYRANIYALQGKDIKDILKQYDVLWEEWTTLKEKHSCCPTLYVKADENQQLIGYEGNRGFDSVINPLRQ